MSTKVQSGKMAQKEGIDPNILTKLVVFAILIAVVPIGTYFASVKYVWNGNATWAAISAVVAANVVLIGYVVVAFGEDAGPTTYLTAGPGPEYLKNKEKPVSEKRKDK